ncbi:MAG: MFS transporter [Verrucomicrobiales bacterium]|nr:MFS transporter [Verrucomicrobiales bacterium]
MSHPQPSSPDTQAATADFPQGLSNAFLFSAFNALSFQIVLGSSMVLYAKALQASATVLGIIAGMMPLLVIFQIPAASYIDRVGYKRFVYGGWGIRVAFIFLMALVPLTSAFLNHVSRLALILALLFAFNLSRGISSSAWLPWITLLVPPTIRGRYVSLDAACVQFGSFVTTIIAAVCLGQQPTNWQFAAIFGFSGLMGAISLGFLKRIPDVPLPKQAHPSSFPVPYREMIAFPPFRKLLWEVFGWAVAYGGMTTFTVAFLKTEAHLSEMAILLLTSTTFLGGLGSLWLGTRLDRFGSKPILLFCFALWVVNLVGWASTSGHLLPPALWLVLLLQFSMGLLAALVNMANTRLAMVLIPEMGRNHFFAIYSVVFNVTLGLTPIVWGLFIDALAGLSFAWHGFELNRFSVFFCAVALAFLAAFFLGQRLEEPQAGRMEDLLRDVLIKSPQRFWLRLWPRS